MTRFEELQAMLGRTGDATYQRLEQCWLTAEALAREVGQYLETDAVHFFDLETGNPHARCDGARESLKWDETVSVMHFGIAVSVPSEHVQLTVGYAILLIPLGGGRVKVEPPFPGNIIGNVAGAVTSFEDSKSLSAMLSAMFKDIRDTAEDPYNRQRSANGRYVECDVPE
jgi:hypothetical protein